MSLFQNGKAALQDVAKSLEQKDYDGTTFFPEETTKSGKSDGYGGHRGMFRFSAKGPCKGDQGQVCSIWYNQKSAKNETNLGHQF